MARPAVQEDFVDLADAVLELAVAPDHHGYQPACDRN
jgi:hypothetical protein